jgi:transitional endoplasmic reticulum ATPase
MEYRYQKRVISEYISNIVAAFGRSTAASNAIVEWIGTHGDILGIDLDDEDILIDVKRRRKVRRRRSTISKNGWKQLLSAIQACKQEYKTARPTTFEKNLEELGSYFRLDYTEKRILDLVCRYRSGGPTENLWNDISENGLVDTTGLIAVFLGLSRSKISKKMSTDSQLIKSGLLTKERNLFQGEMHLNVPRRLIDAISPPNSNFDDICKTLIGDPVEAELFWRDFDHIACERDFVADVLKGAIGSKSKGINFLLYGEPGTGKTEICKTISQKLGLTLYCVGSQDEQGDEPSRSERLTQARLSQLLLADKTNTVVLFDEMEDLISSGSNYLSSFIGVSQSTNAGSKVFVNRLLEENPVPTFWTCNNIQNFDPAILRRMTFAFELKTPSASVREQVWHRILKKENVVLKDIEIRRLAKEFKEAPALAANAVKAAKLAGGGFDRIRLAVEGVGKAVRGGIENPPNVQEISPYQEELTNSELDLKKLTAELSNPNTSKNFSLCLFGPPGTGKSAYVKYLAERIGMEILPKRASDLLSMWVGGTEKNIAAAFKEAKSEKAFLLIDEADSMLQDRSNAQHSWEITQTNEMLTWMEAHDFPFACTTNLMGNLDRASLRRFTFKCKFDYLSTNQNQYAFEYFFNNPAPKEIAHFTSLTPGDFVVVKKMAKVLNPDIDGLVDLLRKECEVKPDTSNPIGFISL